MPWIPFFIFWIPLWSHATEKPQACRYKCEKSIEAKFRYVTPFKYVDHCHGFYCIPERRIKLEFGFNRESVLKANFKNLLLETLANEMPLLQTRSFWLQTSYQTVHLPVRICVIAFLVFIQGGDCGLSVGQKVLVTDIDDLQLAACLQTNKRYGKMIGIITDIDNQTRNSSRVRFNVPFVACHIPNENLRAFNNSLPLNESDELDNIHRGYQSLIETTNITAEIIQNSFVWIPDKINYVHPRYGDPDWLRMTRYCQQHSVNLGRGSLWNGAYLVINVLGGNRNLRYITDGIRPKHKFMIFEFGGGSLWTYYYIESSIQRMEVHPVRSRRKETLQQIQSLFDGQRVRFNQRHAFMQGDTGSVMRRDVSFTSQRGYYMDEVVNQARCDALQIRILTNSPVLGYVIYVPLLIVYIWWYGFMCRF